MFHLGPEEWNKTPPGSSGVETCAHHDAKSDVVVDVARVVVVAIGTARVLMIVPEGAAPHHAVLEPVPATQQSGGTGVASRSGGLLPATQEAANFCHHDRHVCVLPIREPAQARCQTQVHTYVSQGFIGQREAL